MGLHCTQLPWDSLQIGTLFSCTQHYKISCIRDAQFLWLSQSTSWNYALVILNLQLTIQNDQLLPALSMWKWWGLRVLLSWPQHLLTILLVICLLSASLNKYFAFAVPKMENGKMNGSVVGEITEEFPVIAGVPTPVLKCGQLSSETPALALIIPGECEMLSQHAPPSFFGWILWSPLQVIQVCLTTTEITCCIYIRPVLALCQCGA